MFALLLAVSVAAPIDVTRYDVELTLSELSRAPIEAEVEVELEASQPIDQVHLDIDPDTITIHSIHDDGGRMLLYSIVAEKLVIDLAEQKTAESLTIRYRIAVRSESDPRGFFFDSSHHGAPMITTRNWPAHARSWLPSNDHPSDSAEFRFEVIVPAGTIAVANGRLIASGAQMFVWEQEQPIPTYAALIAVGDLARNVPLQFYHPPGLAGVSDYEAHITRAHEAVAYFSTVLGPYQFAKAAFVAAPHPFSMEAASAVVLTDPRTAVHEIIHHWWGNAVQIESWGDFWISEGLTTYFTGFFDEVTSGVNTSCLTTMRKLSVAPDQDPELIYTLDPYCIGAAAIHDYRTWLAQSTGRGIRDQAAIDLFLAVFRRVYEQRAFTATTTREFAQSLSRAAWQELRGERPDLSRFAVDAATEEWLQRWFTDIPPPPAVRRRAVRR